MIKISKKDIEEFNDTDQGKKYNQWKYAGFVMLSLCLLLGVLFGLVMSVSGAAEDAAILSITLIGGVGGYLLGMYYGKLYMFTKK